MSSRYYFNLTNDTVVISDEEGINLADIDTAIVYAIAAIEELRREAFSEPVEWLKWRLEIVDGLGEVISVLPLAVAAKAPILN